MIVVQDESTLNSLILFIQKSHRIGFDVEGSGLDPYTSKLLLIQMGNESESFVIIVDAIPKAKIKYLFELIVDKKILVAGHNLKYDIKMIYHNYNILLTNLYDTMHAETLHQAGIGKPFYALKELTSKYLHINMDKEVRKEFIGKTDTVFTEEQLNYAAQDVEVLLPLIDILQKKVEEAGQAKVWDLERKLEPVVAMMEYTGVSLDVNKWKELASVATTGAGDQHQAILNYIAENFDRIAGKYANAYEAGENMRIPVKQLLKAERQALKELVTRDEIVSAIIPLINLSSPMQAKQILTSMGIDAKSTSKKVLAHFKADELVSYILNFRNFTKRSTAFGEEFLKFVNPVSGKIHTEYNQLRADTGRFGSDSPNLQNIIADDEYRNAFVASPGYEFAKLDYSQIELRIAGEVSGEPLFIEAFKNGDDLHKLTATIIFSVPPSKVTKKQRNTAKSLNFAVLYGTSAYGLNFNFDIPVKDGEVYLEKFFNKYTTLAEFIKGAGNSVLMKGYSITMYGRRRFFTMPRQWRLWNWQDKKLMQKIMRQGVNHVVQGTSADMIKILMIKLFYDNPFGMDNFRLVLTVHDEVVVEYKKEIKEQAIEFMDRCAKEAGEVFLKIVPEAHEIATGSCWIK